MIAKRLERLIGDVAHRSETEMVQRFQKLRDIRLLPVSRGKNAEELTSHQIAAAVLSIVPAKPGHTMYVIGLLKLKPVGGETASFFGSGTLKEAITTIIENDEALNAFLELRASVSETYAQGTGATAEIIYNENGEEKRAYFVQDTALTLMNAGAEQDYNPRAALTQIREDTVFYKKLFQRIARSLREENRRKALFN